MRKFILLLIIGSSILSLISPLAQAQSIGKWNIGVAAGWGSTRTGINERLFYEGNLRDHYKTKLHGNGFIGGVIGDYIMYDNLNTACSLGLGAYLDSYTATDNSHKKNIRTSSTNLIVRDSFKRNYTLETSLKYGIHPTPDIIFYGKIGGLYSSFKRQYRRPSGPWDGKATTSAWGGVIGAGITRKWSSSWNVGLAYDFHYYESLKMKTGPYDNNEFEDLTDTRPRSHQIYLTFTRSI